VVAAIVALGLAGGLRANNIIIGNPLDAGLCVPFGCDSFGPSTQYQQVYANTAFPQPIAIRTITFFNTKSPSGSFLYSNYQVSLSTTNKAVGQLSTNLAENIGGDSQVFFSGILSGAATGRFTISGLGFNYNPAAGNLLLDIQRTPLLPPSGVGSGGIAFDGLAGTASGTYSWMHNYSPLVFPGFGLMTDFSDAVREPGTVALMGAGILSLIVIRRWKTKQR